MGGWQTEDKTVFSRDNSDQRKDAPKILHVKVRSVYETYLRVHYPVLRNNLGHAARHEPVFKDDVHGPGASRCFPLFPGYWPPNQRHSFVDCNFKPVLGCLERKARELEEKQFTPDLRQKFGVRDAAVSQNFHRSEKVSEEENHAGRGCLAGLKQCRP